MGLPDDMESPVRKKPKLSLSTKRKHPCPSTEQCPPIHDGYTGSECNSTEAAAASTSADAHRSADENQSLPTEPLSPSESFIAPVASLYNLGNTCFLNSMLQILRFTPAFLPKLASLKDEVTAMEDKMADNEAGNSSNMLKSDEKQTWQVVKNLHSMYLEMDQREVSYREMPTSDTSQMAVKPVSLLDSVRELNPMFEGNFQHDAQEFLRCMLCYLEEADSVLTGMRDESESEVKPEQENKPKIDFTGESSHSQNCSTSNVSESRMETEAVPVGVMEKRTNVGNKDLQESGSAITCSSGTSKKRLKLKGGAPGSSRKISLRRQAAGTQEAVIDRNIKGRPNRTKRVLPKLEEGLVNGEDTKAEVSETRQTRGQKRKRGQSESVEVVEECSSGVVNGAVSSPVLADNKAETSGPETDKKEEGSRNGIVNLLKTWRDKFVPPRSNKQELDSQPASCDEKFKVEENTSSSTSTRNLLSLVPFKPMRRQGMTNNVSFQGMKSMKENKEINGDVDIRQNINEALEVKQEESSKENVVLSETEGLNKGTDVLLVGDTSPAKSRSPLKHSDRKLESPIKGLNSSFALDASDKITAAEGKAEESLNIESTIGSVTRKYYSTLSRPPLGQVSPLQSSTLPSLEVVPKEQVSLQKSEKKVISPPLSPIRSLRPGEEIVIHSPSKIQQHDTSGSSLRSVASLPTSCDKSDENDRAFFDPDSQNLSNKIDNSLHGNVLNFLPKMLKNLSESLGESEIRDNLLSLDADQVKTRSCRSVPNSPCQKTGLDGLSETNEGKKCEGVLKADVDDQSSNIALSKAVSQVQKLRIEIKRCDWLGVSPVKSVSASRALRGLQKQQLHRAKRNILFDLDSCGNFTSDKQHQVPQIANVGKLTPHSESAVSSVADKESNEAGLLESSSLKKHSEQQFEALENNQTVLNKSEGMFLGSTGEELSKTSTQKKSCGLPETEKVCFQSWRSKGIELKPLTISLQKCDSAQNSLLRKVKGNGKVKRCRRKTRPSQIGAGDFTSSEDKNKDNFEELMWQPLVKCLFGGTMMHLTKCLECELEKEKTEAFLDISVPVRLDGPRSKGDSSEEEDNENTGENPALCLSSLVQSSSSVEYLRDSNKYWCDHCLHLVEAELSCHYVSLPKILSLHLKRFSAGTGLFSEVSKINDKVHIPKELPCLRHECRKACTNHLHRYHLYALATHSGLSILHGHYRAYVKVQPWVSPATFHNLLTSQRQSEYPGAAGSTFPDKVLPSSVTASSLPSNEGCPSPAVSTSVEDIPSWRGWSSLQPGELASTSGNTKSDLIASNRDFPKQERDSVTTIDLTRDEESSMEGSDNQAGHGSRPQCGPLVKTQSAARRSTDDSGDVARNEQPGCFWLECDDECVTVMDETEFENKLWENAGSLLGTPYVLFYYCAGMEN